MTQRLYFDFETEPFARGYTVPRPICMAWAHDSGEVFLEKPDQSRLFYWLESHMIMVGANIAFDMLVAATEWPELLPLVHAKYLRGEICDVLLDRKLLDIAAGRYARLKMWSLDSCAQRAGYPERLDKTSWRTGYKALLDVPIEWWPEGAQRYAKDDVHATRWVDRWNQDEGRGQYPAHHGVLAAQASLTLTRASAWGVLTDPARTEQLAARVEARLAELRTILVPLGLVRPDGSKNTKEATSRIVAAWQRLGLPAALAKEGQKQLTAAVKRGVPQAQAQAELEASGYGIALDKDAAILSEDEVMIAYSEYASQSLILGRVDRARAGWVLPLQTRFDPLKETARTSSTQPSAPIVGEQMQNFNRGKKDEALGLREVFTPRAGNLFLSADGGMAELHALAHTLRVMFGFSRLGDMLDAGIDVHWYMAARYMGMEYEEILRCSQDGTPCPVEGMDWSDLRTMAKAFVFGVPGGMGIDKLILSARKGYGVRVTREQAQKLKALYLDACPELRKMFKWVSDRGGNFTHIHPVTGFIRGGCGYTDGANQFMQHLTAYGAKAALFAVDLACFAPGNPLYGFRIWNMCHDEILLEGPAELCPAAAAELKRICETVYTSWMPSSFTTWDPVICRVWTKKAKTVRKDGAYREYAWTG